MQARLPAEAGCIYCHGNMHPLLTQPELVNRHRSLSLEDPSKLYHASGPWGHQLALQALTSLAWVTPQPVGPAIIGLHLTLVPLTGPDPHPHPQADIPAWPQPFHIPMELPRAHGRGLLPAAPQPAQLPRWERWDRPWLGKPLPRPVPWA